MRSPAQGLGPCTDAQAHPLRVNPRLRMLKTVYKANIDIVHIQRDEASALFSLSAARESAAASAASGASDPPTGASQRQAEDLFQVRRCYIAWGFRRVWQTAHPM